MASNRYASRYRCDFCGKVADLPPDDDDAPVWPGPRPSGWLVRLAQRDMVTPSPLMRMMDGSEYADFCDDCVGLPLGRLVEMLRRKVGEMREPAR
jgi:hypothetical protein